MGKNNITKSTVSALGYHFIAQAYLPEGKDEYYLRNLQNRSGINYRQLTAYEIEVLVRNRNTSDNWNNLLVSDAFNPELVKNCKFYGLVRIGKLEPYVLSFSDLKLPVGLYNSTIISSDFGDNVAIDNVHYMSHYITGSKVIITNVNELVTTDHSKFGNGIVKEGEEESVRIWLEICNENGGRKVIPFVSMQAGDAWLWSRYREDDLLLERFKEFTEKEYKVARGYYGKIGDRTVIKNCGIIKDVWIGADAYIKGANKLKNLTINSGEEGQTQIGEGCELVNGVIGFGCRVFYGVKAVRFIMASHSQLKYGARLINSYLGNNATISCCEVLNSLIFPSHEQHHNNSFLCAAMVMGQSNIPAGATIGSNHNSRGADGEIIVGRGFWPGLCVSLKHNTKVASFTIIAKGDYNYELNIPVPFALVSNDVAKDRLVVMPAYWFLYNMYALARNAWKYADRDNRTERIQFLETDFLAPDSVNEMFDAIALFETAVGAAFYREKRPEILPTDEQCLLEGRQLLQQKNEVVKELEINVAGFENAKRKTAITKVQQAYDAFREMITFYGICGLITVAEQYDYTGLQSLLKTATYAHRNNWLNVGGQLIPEDEVEKAKRLIKEGEIASWIDVHQFYITQGQRYPEQKLLHQLASLSEVKQMPLDMLSMEEIHILLEDAIVIKEKVAAAIHASRAKDYNNPFRKMVYESELEMEKVVGRLEDNSFILQQAKEVEAFKNKVAELKEKLMQQVI
ncbi:DUF4954 family protein [Ilyomonas limi]|uniref:DUF4954 family protein n=1 Tax=Ilyomonas limi TaxID=2575867 RepID=A0A4U3L040_9BACT|nr:DUF4954 family protein [Ilyomonas limi]TKK68288.1 DUF4954 family protein [Ilyomonas limi]